MTLPPANAGNVSQKPDPEVLRQFEAERDAARRDREAAEEKIRQGEEKVKRAQEKRRTMQNETDRQLCEMGLLPNCP